MLPNHPHQALWGAAPAVSRAALWRMPAPRRRCVCSADGPLLPKATPGRRCHGMHTRGHLTSSGACLTRGPPSRCFCTRSVLYEWPPASESGTLVRRAPPRWRREPAPPPPRAHVCHFINPFPRKERRATSDCLSAAWPRSEHAARPRELLVNGRLCGRRTPDGRSGRSALAKRDHHERVTFSCRCTYLDPCN